MSHLLPCCIVSCCLIAVRRSVGGYRGNHRDAHPYILRTPDWGRRRRRHHTDHLEWSAGAGTVEYGSMCACFLCDFFPHGTPCLVSFGIYCGGLNLGCWRLALSLSFPSRIGVSRLQERSRQAAAATQPRNINIFVCCKCGAIAHLVRVFRTACKSSATASHAI